MSEVVSKFNTSYLSRILLLLWILSEEKLFTQRRPTNLHSMYTQTLPPGFRQSVMRVVVFEGLSKHHPSKEAGLLGPFFLETLLSPTFGVLRLDWWLRDVTLHLNSYRREGSNTLTWPLVWRHGHHCPCTPFEGPDVTGDLFWLPKFLDHHVSSIVQKVPGYLEDQNGIWSTRIPHKIWF